MSNINLSDYQEVEYLQSSGTQYINTGYKTISENYRTISKFEVINLVNNAVLFGGGSSTDIISAMMTSASQLKFYVGSGSVSSALTSFTVGTEYEMECTANNGNLTVTLNGTSRSGTYSGAINKDYPLFIFANNSSGAAAQYSSLKVYWFQIYDNGILVRDFVPCYRKSDNVAGLYDTVNGEFYTNAGTGTFAIGPEISESPEIPEPVVTDGLMPFAFALRRRLLQKAAGANFETVDASFTISGGMEDTTVNVSGKTYRLMKITKSGDLALAAPCAVSICLVGGGGNGGRASAIPGGGGGGGYMTHLINIGKVQNLTFSIGSAAQATTVSGDASGIANPGSSGDNNGNGGNGGSGGGVGSGGYSGSSVEQPGKGDGKRKYPFGITSLNAHCAGGGGGNSYYVEMYEYDEDGFPVDYYEHGLKGSNGGTNGGNGSSKNTSNISTSAQTQVGGSGGTYGGGTGGRAHYSASYAGGSAGTFYGAGGGGGGSYIYYDDYYGSEYNYGSGGSGYQGVAYVIAGSFPASV